MWRSLIPSAIAVLFAANLWVQGNAQTRRQIVVVFGILGLLVALAEWAYRHPERKWARALIRIRGPRTDGTVASRSEGLSAAWAFLRFGLLALLLLAAVMFGMTVVTPSWAQTALLIAMPFVLFPAAMGILGGLYLLVRASFRE
jgi:hypothetical protein